MPPSTLSGLSRRSTLAAAGTAAALVAGVGGVAGYAAWSAADTSVQLLVDGEPRLVTTRGETVADVLTEASRQADKDLWFLQSHLD